MGVRSERDLEELIKAAYPLIYIVSPEESRVEESIKKVGTHRKPPRLMITWSITEGFKDPSNRLPEEITDPIRALTNIEGYEGDAIFVMRDFHPYLNDPVIVRKLRDLVRKFASAVNKKHIILLSPVFRAPRELEKDMALVEWKLPDKDEIERILMDVYYGLPGPVRKDIHIMEDEEQKERVIDAALGLTAAEVHYVLSRSLVRTRTFDIDTILEEKKHIIKKSGILEFYEAKEEWGHVGGLQELKIWLEQRKFAFTKEAREFGVPVPKGILLIGIPGCGKSLTAKAVGGLWKMPLLRLDVGKVFSSLVGSSEENIRRAIATAE